MIKRKKSDIGGGWWGWGWCNCFAFVFSAGPLSGLIFWVFGGFQRRAFRPNEIGHFGHLLKIQLVRGFVGSEFFFANHYFAGDGLVYFGCFLDGSFSRVMLFLGLGGVVGFPRGGS